MNIANRAIRTGVQPISIRDEKYILVYVLPPLLISIAALASFPVLSTTMLIVLVSFALGLTQIVNPCGLAHTCALTKPLGSLSSARRWLSGISTYTIAGCLSATVTGSVLGFVGGLTIQNLPPIAPMAFLVAAGAVVVLRELGILQFQLPEIRRQTRSRWIQDRRLINHACWAIDVGFAFFTWQLFAGAYFLALVALVFGDPWLGAAIFCGYWLGRALPHWMEPALLPDPSRRYLYTERIGSLIKPMQVIQAVGVVAASLSIAFSM